MSKKNTLISLALFFIIVGTSFFLFVQFTEMGKGLLQEVRETVRETKQIAKLFHSGEVTTRFISHSTRVEGVKRLQFVSLKQVEVFEKEEIKKYFNVNVAKASVRISVPVEYIYYVDLDKKWSFEYDEELNLVKVQAPEIRFNRPSASLSQMSIEFKKSFFVNEEKLRQELMQDMTVELLNRAKDNIHLIKEVAKRETIQFVKNFFVKQFAKGFSDYSKIQKARFKLEFQRMKNKPYFKETSDFD